MVQLIVLQTARDLFCDVYFNSTMVQLIGGETDSGTDGENNFNSTMVQLIGPGIYIRCWHRGISILLWFN